MKHNTNLLLGYEIMDKTLKLIKQALKSDPDYKCSLTEAIDILWDAYHSNVDRFNSMLSSLKAIEDTD